MSENIENINEENVEETDYNDIIDSCIGYDEDDNPKAGFSVEVGTYDSATSTIKVDTNLSYFNPQINLMRTGEAIIIDFIFRNKTDTDMRAIWSLLNKYGRNFDNAMKVSSATIPVFRFTIVPVKYEARFGILCTSPMYWALEPETPTSDINTIRVVFGIDNVVFQESEGYNLTEIEADIQREQMQRDFIEGQMEQRREEEAEYREERNAKIEELRRNKEDLY